MWRWFGAEYGLCGDVWGCCRRVVQATPDPDPPARDNNLLLLIGYCFREAVKDNSKGRGGGMFERIKLNM